MRRRLTYVFLAVACVTQGQLDSLTWDATAWGQHRSNALSHELGRLLVRGGHINRSLVEAARTAQGDEMGSFGYTSGLALNWRNPRSWKDTEARLCGSFQFKTLGDIRWTPELFDLAFTGNAGHLGRWDVLDGSRYARERIRGHLLECKPESHRTGACSLPLRSNPEARPVCEEVDYLTASAPHGVAEGGRGFHQCRVAFSQEALPSMRVVGFTGAQMDRIAGDTGGRPTDILAVRGILTEICIGLTTLNERPLYDAFSIDAR